MKRENESLKKENLKVKNDNRRLRGKLSACQRKVKRMKQLRRVHKPSRVAQALQRKQRSILLWKARAKSGIALAKEMNTKLRKRKSTSQPKVSPAVHKITVASLKYAVDALNKFKTEYRVLENQIEEKNEMLKEASNNDICTRVDGRSINPKLKEASMYLQQLGIAEHRCSEALKLTVESVTDSKLEGKLPSRSTQSRLASEMKALAMQEVVDNLADQDNYTVGYDGTTDPHGRHVTEVEISTKDKTLLIGLRNQESAKAVSYTDTIMDSLHDISPDIAKKVSNTMTDRCKTNDAVDRLLEDRIGSTLNHFRCGMHPLDSFHKHCDKVLCQIESERPSPADTYTTLPYKHRGESWTQALIRVMDKLFHDNSINIGEDLSTFLRGRGFSTTDGKALYQRWVGNKFNVLFRNASLAFLYTPHIIEFLTKVNRCRNSAAIAVLNMLEGAVCHEELRCLGLIHRYLTGPWMERVGQNSNILDMNQPFFNAKQHIESWINNPAPLFTTLAMDCFGDPVQKDLFLTEAQLNIGESATPTMKRLLQGILDVLVRQLEDQLPGGVYWNPSDDLRREASSCSSNNISGERKFGKMKAWQHRAPAMLMTKIESKEMFDVNDVKTSLLRKTKDERAKAVRWATRQGAAIRLKDRQRDKMYKARVRERIEAKRQELSDKEQQNREDIEKIVEIVFLYGGYWTHASQIQQNAQLIKGILKRKEAVKNQIRLRTIVLETKTDRKVRFTMDSIEEQEDHLQHLIEIGVPENMTFLEDIIVKPESVVGRRIKQMFDVSGVEKIYRGVISKMVTNEHNLPEFEFLYDNEDTPCYEAREELIVDIARGDIVLE